MQIAQEIDFQLQNRLDIGCSLALNGKLASLIHFRSVIAGQNCTGKLELNAACEFRLGRPLSKFLPLRVPEKESGFGSHRTERIRFLNATSNQISDSRQNITGF